MYFVACPSVSEHLFVKRESIFSGSRSVMVDNLSSILNTYFLPMGSDRWLLIEIVVVVVDLNVKYVLEWVFRRNIRECVLSLMFSVVWVFLRCVWVFVVVKPNERTAGNG